MSGPRISALLDELEELLRPLYPAGVAFGRTAKDVDANDSPPRIIWTFPSVTHGAAEKIRIAGEKRPTTRALLTRTVTVSAHCWGESLDATEQLVHDLLASAHKAAWGSIAFLGEEWADEEHGDFGTLAIVRLGVSIPVTRKPLQRVTPTALELDITGAVPGDGVIEGNEP